MPGEKKFMFIGVEDGYGVPGIVEIVISSVFTLGVPGLVTLSVPIHGIPGAVDYILPGIVSLGYSISVSN